MNTKKRISLIVLALILIVAIIVFGRLIVNKPLATGDAGLDLLVKEYGNQKIVSISNDFSSKESVIEDSVYELDNESIKEKVDEIKLGIEDTALTNNQDFDQYIIQNGYENIEEFENETEEQITDFVKLRLAVYEYAKENNITISKKEYENMLEEYAIKFGYENTDEFKEECDKSTVTCEMLYDKTLNLMLN